MRLPLIQLLHLLRNILSYVLLSLIGVLIISPLIHYYSVIHLKIFHSFALPLPYFCISPKIYVSF